LLRDPEEVAEGDTVHLYPQTKQASTNVHRLLQVKIGKPPKAHWPMVLVVWTERGTSLWEMVHRDNIRKHPATAVSASVDKKQGDSANDGGGGGMSKWVKRGIMPGKPKPELDGQEPLF
jgi:hypothetical protein